tara:strand:+ start:1145 stop:1687 length:543 start_codon:yes stop_codon:yes gene_type:complete
MDIPISFRAYLYWKNIFKKHKGPPRIKISKEGKGVRSILFFLPKKKEEAKIAYYLIKTDNPLPNHNIGFVCNEDSMSFYPNGFNAKIFSYNDNDLNYFGAIRNGILLDQIKSISYDALVDLNTNFCAPTSLLALDLNIPLKIGFDSIIAENLYTVTLERNKNKFIENNFQMIERLLGLEL